MSKPGNSVGVLTHFWITGGDYMCGNDTNAGTCAPPLGRAPGDWNPFIDFVRFRFYVDGEDAPSIEFAPNMACGVGPFRSRTHVDTAPPTFTDGSCYSFIYLLLFFCTGRLSLIYDRYMLSTD